MKNRYLILLLIVLCACTPMLSNQEHLVLEKQHDILLENQEHLMDKLNQISDNQAIQEHNMRLICGVEAKK